MSPTPPPKPVIETAPVERKPSEWSPRSIPVPKPGRSTADPRTPTLRELAARERARVTSLAADPAAWIGVQVLTPDGRPLLGGAFDVTALDGRAHAGQLAGNGRGRVDGITPGLCSVGVPRPDADVSDSAWDSTAEGEVSTAPDAPAPPPGDHDLDAGPRRPAGYWVEDFEAFGGEEGV